jgi:putative membrane protein
MKAAQGGMMEVEAGKVAQSKAQHAEVKQFAQRMVTDHGKANDELKALARSKNVELPTALDKQHRAHVDNLGKQSGAEFDRAYMKHMVDDHKKDVAEFEKQSKSAKDPDLRKWAGEKLPTLREHLKMAESTHAAVAKGGAGASAASKTGGTVDPTKPVETANSKGNTSGTNTANIAGAAPKAQTTGK